MSSKRKLAHADTQTKLQRRASDQKSTSESYSKPQHQTTRLQQHASAIVETIYGWGSRDLNAQLMMACSQENVPVARHLVQAAADPGARDANGWTPLASAVHSQCPEIVKFLLFEAKANCEAHFSVHEPSSTPEEPPRVHHRWTALMLAARDGNAVAALSLMCARADVGAHDDEGLTPLMIAGQHGNEKVAAHIVTFGGNVGVHDVSGHTAFDHAMINDEFEVARFLLTAKAEVDGRATSGLTPLMRAAREGNLAAAKFLLDSKANLRTPNFVGTRALAHAAQSGRSTMCTLLRERGAEPNAQDTEGRTAVMRALEQGELQTIRVLTASKADVNITTRSGRSCLMEAGRRGLLQVLSFLLYEAKVSCNSRDLQGRTALMYAAEEGRAAAVWMLLQANASPNAQTRFGHTALHLGARKGHVAVVEYLLQAKADIDQQSAQGHTGLMLAARHGEIPMAKLLVRANASLETHTSHGRTALMFAAEHGKASIVKLLVDADSDPLARAENGKTALHHAAQHGLASIVTFLLSLPSPFQPDLSAIDNRGRTALRLSLEAIARKHSKFGRTRKIMANSSLWTTAHTLLTASRSLNDIELSLLEDICFIPPARRRRRTERISTLFQVLEKCVPAIVLRIVFNYDDVWHLSDGLWKAVVGKLKEQSAQKSLDENSPVGSSRRHVTGDAGGGEAKCRKFVLGDTV
mmetsp:Transcript_5468/g.13323  ORF Transcript_5468/g.13323 Transcript_5468/m.13323 type:complete len:695 (-) Transcript_5468:22-2106(-)